MANATNIGKITQVIGPVVDVSFEDSGNLSRAILDALEVIKSNGQRVVLECQQHLGEDRIRTIAMDSTEGMQRGMQLLRLDHLSKCQSVKASKDVCSM
jgi:F-type H+-transporting ATPase subunit beta